MTISEEEAFKAMYAFLVNFYERTESDEVGSLLGSMSLLSDGRPADPAIWSEWLECVRRARAGEIRLDLGLS